MPDSLEDINLRSDEVQEVLSKVPNWMIRWGSLLFLLLIALLLVITYYIKYPDIIEAEGVVTTNIPPEKIIANRTAKIETILVEDQQRVFPGEPLAILRSTAVYKDVFLLGSIIDSIVISDEFTFPLESLPKNMQLGDITNAFSIFESNYLAYSLHRRLNPFVSKEDAAEVTRNEIEVRLHQAYKQRKLYTNELELLKKDISRYHDLFENGVISSQEFEQKKIAQLQAERTLSNLNVSISQFKEMISIANKDYTAIEIDHTKEDVVLLNQMLRSYAQLKQAIDTWKLLHVYAATIEGKVSFLKYWSPYQNVYEGDLIFTVIPKEKEKYVGKLKVSHLNFGKLEVGQHVWMKVESYPYQEFGVLKGLVERVSVLPDKDGLYAIDVALPDTLITSYQRELAFKQEMRVQAEIVTKDLRLITRFFHKIIENTY